LGIKAHGKGLLLEILRYTHEVRAAEPYFEKLAAEPSPDAVQLAAELIERETGRFEPKKMPDEYSRALHELVRAKVESRAPEIAIAEEKPLAPVINIMAALKQSMQKSGQAKVRDAVRRRMGKAAPQPKAAKARPQAKARPGRTAH
jgi:DNA end-binding protein Ku